MVIHAIWFVQRAGHFQSLMEEVLQPFRSFAAGLLDDVAIWADTIQDLHKRILDVFKRCVDYGLLLNSEKCRLFVTEGFFLGFLISKKGIIADPQKIAAIRDRPIPTDTSEIRSFVNAAGYLRSLIKKFSHLAGPLTDQSVGPKNKPGILTPESITPWKTIKQALTSSPILRKFDWRLPIILETDASKKFVGAVLLQPHLHFYNSKNSFLHPISYFSRKLNETQQRYSAQERELLCILLSLQHWCHWVEGGNITIITDHQSLSTLNTKMEQPARNVRFLDTKEHYYVKIIYRKGKANVLADYLSRPPDRIYQNFPAKEDEEEGNENSSLTSDNNLELGKIKFPHQLNRIDLQRQFVHIQMALHAGARGQHGDIASIGVGK